MSQINLESTSWVESELINKAELPVPMMALALDTWRLFTRWQSAHIDRGVGVDIGTVDKDVDVDVDAGLA